MVALPVKKTGKGGLGGMLGSAKATTGAQKFSSKKERRDKERDTVAPTSAIAADAIRPQVRGPHPHRLSSLLANSVAAFTWQTLCETSNSAEL